MNFFRREFHNIHSRKTFAKILDREIARVHRSSLRFSVVNFNFGNNEKSSVFLRHLVNLLSKRLRLTDDMGWIDDEHIGVLLYNTNSTDAYGFAKNIQETLASKTSLLDYEIFIYPQNDQQKDGWDQNRHQNFDIGTNKSADTELKASQASFQNLKGNPLLPIRYSNSNAKKEYAESVQRIKLLYRRKMPIWKRCLDILGAVFGLAISFPLFILISAIIKIVSPGTVLFKQERIGYGGTKFTFLKFRTMKMKADTSVHQRYLSGLINGSTECTGSDGAMAKMDADNPQIIPFGRILRKTYLDELPQLINVLRGEMSLIGPRPPISYEVEEYLWWHKGRFDAVPGMTGLWQVSGKNKLTFKEMTRLDIQYSRTLSFLLDLKILLKTPYTIFSELIFSR
jgi:lipopolysaccharide/colanic/teichoic acid biosynthesis glycosyltransferase